MTIFLAVYVLIGIIVTSAGMSALSSTKPEHTSRIVIALAWIMSIAVWPIIVGSWIGSGLGK